MKKRKYKREPYAWIVKNPIPTMRQMMTTDMDKIMADMKKAQIARPKQKKNKKEEMKSIIKDESGIAYAILMMFTALCLSALLFFVFQEPIDVLNDILNDMIADGDISTNTSTTITLLNKIFLIGLPVFTIITFIEYGIIKALEAKRDEGY